MQNVIEILLSNIFVVMVVISFLISLLKKNPEDNESRIPKRENQWPKQTYPEHPDVPTQSMPDLLEIPSTQESPDPESKPGQPVIHLESVEQSELEQQEEDESVDTPYQRPYEKPYQKTGEIQIQQPSSLSRQALIGMMWAQIYGPPRSKSPFSYRRYKRY